MGFFRWLVTHSVSFLSDQRNIKTLLLLHLFPLFIRIYSFLTLLMFTFIVWLLHKSCFLFVLLLKHWFNLFWTPFIKLFWTFLVCLYCIVSVAAVTLFGLLLIVMTEWVLIKALLIAHSTAFLHIRDVDR